ncbi:MAG TPA: hypothetical protein DDW52_02110 [Planctomycetaceae bacterium]|nr:hypothetical protein [Planctomycetaceae bacterium]
MKYDDSVGNYIRDTDDHERFLDFCEYMVGFDAEGAGFSIIRSWENEALHETAWQLYDLWQEWLADVNG